MSECSQLDETLAPPIPLQTPKAWKNQFELLGHLCQFSNNILLVLGAEQTGKTCFSRLLEYTKLIGTRKVRIDGKAIHDTTQLMKAIALGFHLPWDKPLDPKTIQSDDQGQVWAVIVDDADYLEERLFRDLLSLVDFSLPLRQQLHLILVGKPTLEITMLQEPIWALIGDKIQVVELIPYSDESQKQQPKLERDGAPMASTTQSKRITKTPLPQEEQPQPLRLFSPTWFKQLSERPVLLGICIGICVSLLYMLMMSSERDTDTQPPQNYAIDESNVAAAQAPPAPTELMSQGNPQSGIVLQYPEPLDLSSAIDAKIEALKTAGG